MTLQKFFHQHPKAALAFSGGADSAYLLWAGRTWGEDVRPYYVSTPFQPAADRCYHCKQALFSALWQRVRADGYSLLLDGTNASDDAADRPGMRALRELEVRSPLRACGITKTQVRTLSREAGLFTWDKPAYACLATRIPTGTPIAAADLARVEGGEDALFALGFTNFRIRLRRDTGVIQLPQSQMARAITCRPALTEALAPYFAHTVLDLQPRPEEE